MIYKLFVRHNLIWLLLILLAFPGLLGLIVLLRGEDSLYKWMSSHYQLGGAVQPIELSKFDLSHIKSQDFQKSFDKWITNKLPLRSFFIRMHNQAFYILFKRSYAENSLIIIGKSNQLFSVDYIKAYCDINNPPFNDPKQLIAWADKLKVLSQFFASKGKTFIYLITPSKAEYMPRAIPKRFHCLNSPKPSNHRIQIKKLLDERGVRYIDAQEILKKDNPYSIPMFARGGIHWNWLAAELAANKIIEQVNQARHAHLKPIHFHYTIGNNTQYTPDADLLTLLNLAMPDFNHPTPYVDFSSLYSKNPPVNAVFIGGSFLGHLLGLFSKSNSFYRMSHYDYFNLGRIDYVYGKENEVDKKVDMNSIKMLDKIMLADVVILEENSSRTISIHGQLFFDSMKKFFAL